MNGATVNMAAKPLQCHQTSASGVAPTKVESPQKNNGDMRLTVSHQLTAETPQDLAQVITRFVDTLSNIKTHMLGTYKHFSFSSLLRKNPLVS